MNGEDEEQRLENAVKAHSSAEVFRLLQKGVPPSTRLLTQAVDEFCKTRKLGAAEVVSAFLFFDQRILPIFVEMHNFCDELATYRDVLVPALLRVWKREWNFRETDLSEAAKISKTLHLEALNSALQSAAFERRRKDSEKGSVLPAKIEPAEHESLNKRLQEQFQELETCRYEKNLLGAELEGVKQALSKSKEKQRMQCFVAVSVVVSLPLALLLCRYWR